MGQAAAAARVDDPFGHSSAMSGVLVGLAVGALIGVAIIATGGLGAIAIGAAIATTGGAGLAGQAIGQTIDGPDTGELKIGSPTIAINGKPATMTVLASGRCDQDSGPLRLVATGSATVLFHQQLAARVGESMDCSAVIREGSPNVFIGGPSAQVLDIGPEVPTWLTTTMTAMAIGGSLIATAGVAATYGIGAAAGSLVGGAAGGWAGGQGGSWAAAQMGFGETGQAVGGVLGGLAGGALGGGLGFRGGAAAQSRLRSPTGAPTAAGAGAAKPGAGKPMSPADEARSWQGRGNSDYPGVDRYRNVTLKPGTRVIAGEPGQGHYYTTQRGFARSGGSQDKLWKGLQVNKHPDYPMRSAVREYEVVEPTPAAFGVVRANPQHGDGGLPQLYIPDYSKLRPLDVTPLSIP